MPLNANPTNAAEWARHIESRLRALENPRSIRLGNWLLSVSPNTGDLVADHIPTGRRIAIAEAEARAYYKET